MSTSAARQRDDAIARDYRIHASSSVRVSVRESRYFTITGVASDRPHSTPLPDGDGARAGHDDGALAGRRAAARPSA